MKTNFRSYSTNTIFEKIGSNLGTEVSENCIETKFYIPAHAGSGSVSNFSFNDGLGMFLFNGQLSNDWEWEFSCEEDSPLYIFFSIAGEVEDVRYSEQTRFQMRPMETLLISQPGGGKRSIVFKAGSPISIAVISIRKEKFLENKGYRPEDLPKEIQQILNVEEDENTHYLPPDRMTLNAALLVQGVLDCPYEGLLRTCFIEAKTRELLFMQLHRTGLPAETEAALQGVGSVNIEKMNEASQVLIRDLRNAPTIEELSRLVGVNRQKLKQDFKMVFGKTIFQYLREERLNTARALFLSGQLPVREVAAKVGYNNSSHFSRRFQEHFGILPSKFIAIARQNPSDNLLKIRNLKDQ